MSSLFAIFFSIFLAELGDKTQLAALMFASDSRHNPWAVFFAASSALICSTALAVLLGSAAEKYLSVLPLKLISGVGFILIGLWMVYGYFAGAKPG
ncbi:MAG TPA: TMEM165/GDT1 family protein [Hellea balneolensis]|uniref:GDT1 family protein n=1 Tax=Hellea balneolensis TaxID=287478 RepID=A0A7V5NWF9_9PROT|nr:TMEM165/GDT1 family protein [Hellea balneolensis]